MSCKFANIGRSDAGKCQFWDEESPEDHPEGCGDDGICTCDDDPNPENTCDGYESIGDDIDLEEPDELHEDAEAEARPARVLGWNCNNDNPGFFWLFDGDEPLVKLPSEFIKRTDRVVSLLCRIPYEAGFRGPFTRIAFFCCGKLLTFMGLDFPPKDNLTCYEISYVIHYMEE
jgi:hypothetical protein